MDAPDPNRAESALMFTAELLRLVYEMEHMTKRFTGKAKEEGPDEGAG